MLPISAWSCGGRRCGPKISFTPPEARPGSPGTPKHVKAARRRSRTHPATRRLSGRAAEGRSPQVVDRTVARRHQRPSDRSDAIRCSLPKKRSLNFQKLRSAAVQLPQPRRDVVGQVDLCGHPIEECVVVSHGEAVELDGGEQRRDRGRSSLRLVGRPGDLSGELHVWALHKLGLLELV